VSAIPQLSTVDALASVWTSLRELLLTLTPEQWHAPTALPGWDVQANVAHIVGTEASLLGQDASPVTNPPPEVDTEPPAHVRNEIGEFNELSVQAMATATPEETVERFDEVTARRLTELREMPQGEWDAETMAPAGRNAYGRFMQIRVFDCWFHEQDIRDAVGRPGHANHRGISCPKMSTHPPVCVLGIRVPERGGGPDNVREFLRDPGGGRPLGRSGWTAWRNHATIAGASCYI